MQPARIRLRHLLHDRQMNRSQLSQMTGIRPNTIGNYYAEMCDSIKLLHITKICKALNCEVSDLLQIDDLD